MEAEVRLGRRLDTLGGPHRGIEVVESRKIGLAERHDGVPDPDFRDAPETLHVRERLERNVHVGRQQVEGGRDAAVDDDRAHFRAHVDQAVGLQRAQRLPDGVAACRQVLAELSLGRQRVADPEPPLADQRADTLHQYVDRGAVGQGHPALDCP